MAPARRAVDPISIWNWVKANDSSGGVFGGQQFTWLFSTAFLRNQAAVQETIALLASNPNPVEPEAYDRQAQAYLHFDALDSLLWEDQRCYLRHVGTKTVTTLAANPHRPLTQAEV